MISWNALPGDMLYGIKTGLENVALGVTIRTPLASRLTVKYTERRFTEASRLLSSKGSTLGYDLLIQETQKSSSLILEKNDSANAEDLRAKIEDYKQEINQKKIAIASGAFQVPSSDGGIATATQQQDYFPENNGIANQNGNPPSATTPRPDSIPTPVSTSPATKPPPTPISTKTPLPGATELVTPLPTVVAIPKADDIAAESEADILDKLEKTENQLSEISDTLSKLPQQAPRMIENVPNPSLEKSNNLRNSGIQERQPIDTTNDSPTKTEESVNINDNPQENQNATPPEITEVQ